MSINQKQVLVSSIIFMFLLFAFNFRSFAQSNSINITIIYSPESDVYMTQIMANFNARACSQSISPVDLMPLPQPICIVGKSESSGIAMDNIVNGANNVPRDDGTPVPTDDLPTIFQPSVSHWLRLATLRTNNPTLFSRAEATALAPVVIAIWESRLNAIQQNAGTTAIGWADLLNVLNSPNGWCNYNVPNCRPAVYYGHTDPRISSTGLSTLLAEFYAAASLNGSPVPLLTLNEVDNGTIQQSVRDIQQLVRHYSPRTTEFKEYIALGSDYIDFVALEENDLIDINCNVDPNNATFSPPAGDRLVALYPTEGTFIHEHPMAVVNAAWTTQDQQSAASIFIDYVLQPTAQQLITSYGFRPISGSLGAPFENETCGANPNFNLAQSLALPDSTTISRVLDLWPFIKKQADILLVIDVSRSMITQVQVGNGSVNQLQVAKNALIPILSSIDPSNRVGLMTFNDQVQLLAPLQVLDPGHLANLSNLINNLQAAGETALYQATLDAVTLLAQQPNIRMRKVILISDGDNNITNSNAPAAQVTGNMVVTAINTTSTSRNPVQVFPLAYGSQGNVQALQPFATASFTVVFDAIANPLEIETFIETRLAD